MVRINQIRKKGDRIIVLEEKGGEAIDSLYNIKTQEKKVILSELDMALKRWKKTGYLPMQYLSDHILYNRNAPEGEKIKFVKPIGFNPYTQNCESVIKYMTKRVLGA